MTKLVKPEVGASSLKLYSGTAAFELEAVQAPALKVIEQINQRVGIATQIAVLSSAHLWNQDAAARWLAPLGNDLRSVRGDISSLMDSSRWMPEFFDIGSVYNAGTATTFAVDSIREIEKVSDDSNTSLAFGAFKDLMRWLEATDREVADMVGIGRTTPYTWSREGREPRRSTVRKLFQAHSLISALVDALGEDAAIRWISIEHPDHRESLLAGNLSDVQAALHEILFKRRRRRVRPGSWVADSADSDE